jgi:hypothetical protein
MGIISRLFRSRGKPKDSCDGLRVKLELEKKDERSLTAVMLSGFHDRKNGICSIIGCRRHIPRN